MVALMSYQGDLPDGEQRDPRGTDANNDNTRVWRGRFVEPPFSILQIRLSLWYFAGWHYSWKDGWFPNCR